MSYCLGRILKFSDFLRRGVFEMSEGGDNHKNYYDAFK